MKAEIEHEIRQENKGRKKHYKSLFNSMNEPLASEAVPTQKLKIRRSKNSKNIQKIRRKEEISLETKKDPKKTEIRKFIKQRQKKTKQKETLEKNLDLEKHLKIQQNLKVLHRFIKKKRSKPHEETSVIREEASLYKNDEFTKSDKQSSRKTDSSKRHRRSYNKSRLYQDEKKLFEDIFKHKNNQSLDTKIDKQFKGHLKYNPLSEDKEADPKQYSLYDNSSKRNKVIRKKRIIQADNYFSAPVSTKENDQKNNTGKLNIKKKGDAEGDKFESAPDESTVKEEVKASTPKEPKDDIERYEVHIPKVEEIENIFMNQDASPKDKVIHMSVINSMDNFEEDKNPDNINSEPEIEIQHKNSASNKSEK